MLCDGLAVYDLGQGVAQAALLLMPYPPQGYNVAPTAAGPLPGDF